MTEHRYELRLVGAPPERVLVELGVASSVAGPSETVLITNRIGQGDLRELLVRISDLGLDMRELRQLPAATTVDSHG